MRDIGRGEAMVALYSGGATMEEIGSLYGITRERVRQVLRLAGCDVYRHGPTVDAVRVVTALRSPGVLTMAAVSRAAGYDHLSTNRALKELGLYIAARRLLAWRRDSRRRARVLIGIQKAAMELGRTPSAKDLKERGIFQITVERAFGSCPEAMARAGIDPRRKGYRIDETTRRMPRRRTA